MSEQQTQRRPQPGTITVVDPGEAACAIDALVEDEKTRLIAAAQEQSGADMLARIADEGLRSALIGLQTTLKEREARDGKLSLKEEAAEIAKLPRQAQLILPLFEAAYALPNVFLRSALFPAHSTQHVRRPLNGEKIFAVGDWYVTLTGWEFDQSDLDVLAGIFEIGTPVELGNEFVFSSYRLLKLLGKQTGGEQYDELHRSIIRLTGGVVQIKRKNRGRIFFGPFIKEGEAGEPDASGARSYRVMINANLGVLFGFDMWSQVNRAQRRALGKNSTAKALHGYYSTHAAPGAHRYETLASIAGLQNKQRTDVKRKVIKAHDALKDPKVGFLASYEAGPETITVQKAAVTKSQQRHLSQTPARRRGRPRKHAQ